MQNLLAGSNVADDTWHTVRFSRRASNLKLQVDSAQPVRGTLCTYARGTTRTTFVFTPNVDDDQGWFWFGCCGIVKI